MMGKMKTIVLLLFVTVLAAGCASRYDFTLTDGTKITAQGKPKLSKDKNVWYYTDLAGRTNKIPAGNVLQVAPQSMDNNDDQPKFNSVLKKN